MDGVQRFGERLVSEVEVETLSELFASLRESIDHEDLRSTFGIPELDALLAPTQPQPRPAPPQQQQQQPGNAASSEVPWRPDPPQTQTPREKPSQGGPILELISPPTTQHPSPSGKTSILTLLTTLSILPSTLTSTPLHGQSSTIILLDPLSHFSVPRLATAMTTHIHSCLHASHTPLTPPLRTAITSLVTRSLSHLHIFRPQSWSALLATLAELETYLLSPSHAHKHKSQHRAVRALIVDDVDAFAWALRASASSSENPLANASARLTRHLVRLSRLLGCAVVVSARAVAMQGVYRAAMPVSWPKGVVVTRVAVRRVEVVRFAPGISVEEAGREAGERWEVVRRARFEVWRVGGRTEDGGEGFVFWVNDRGVGVERAGG
ncbi:hypothetical protein EJ04DRAFT_528001 [Polyplosphaeria fusca]|uniref:Uncharacterized protein n=1 Tax=Polyplosphaeria fusca TaxID=682080 RepID=A0A9P4UUR4_9PLEO|nr:hypothetical protein EJ04DRAFT_528001 [Polyplosphaeria fusca]